MWRARLLNIVIAFALTAARTVSAQRDVEPPGKDFHKIISVDSMQFRGLTLSPDGRWLTIDAEDGIWIMPADGHAKPSRLLSPGYADRYPGWFLSGDRLAFMSDRASRDGSRKTYAMTVSIDPKTGQATAPPRQISTDEVQYVGQVSPDGKWVTYGVPGEHAIKAVPATGGASRTLVTMEHAGPPFIWSGDGKTLYFVVRGGPIRASYNGVWYKVSANGGPATRAYQNAAAMPYAPNTDMHVVLVERGEPQGGIRRVELYDAKERLVKATDVTGEMNYFFPRGSSGRMYAATLNRRYENSLLTLDGGATRTLAASRYAWVNGWAGNSTLLVDGQDSGRAFVASLDTAGHEGTHVLLPADAQGTGWGGVVGYATAFFRGPATSDSNPVYIADARSGAIKELAAKTFSVESDGSRFVVGIPNGQQIELRGITIDGRSTLIRSFAKSDNIRKMTARGDLVAWAIPSNDSISVFSARGPTGRAHKLITVRSNPRRRFELVWSFDATMLAVTGETAQPSLSVIHVDESGAPIGAPVVLMPRATELWSMRWTSDNRSLVLTGIPVGARDEVLMRVPVDPKEAPTFYGRNDEWPVVSPDGKHVAYPAVRTLGTTLWWADFAPPGSVGSTRTP